MPKCKKCGEEVANNWGDSKNPICHLCGRKMTEKDWDVLIEKNTEACVCCGAAIPEGRQICKKCEVTL